MNRLSSLFLLFVLVISPLAVYAQGGDGEDMQTYTSEDGLLSVQYPAEGWVAQTVEDGPPFPHVAIAKEQTLDILETDDDPRPGDAVIIVMLFPAEFVGLMLEDDPEAPVFPEDATPAELATFFAQLFSEDEGPEEGSEVMEATAEPTMDATSEPTPEFEVEEVEVNDDLTVGVAHVSDDSQDAVIVAYEINEGIYTVVFAATYPGEFDEEHQQLLRDIVANITYEGTAEDIMSNMMAEPMAPTGEEVLDGETLINERCTVCHDRERIDSQDKDEAGWTATVDRMISYGAQLTANERDALIEYLVATH